MDQSRLPPFKAALFDVIVVIAEISSHPVNNSLAQFLMSSKVIQAFSRLSCSSWVACFNPGCSHTDKHIISGSY